MDQDAFRLLLTTSGTSSGGMPKTSSSTRDIHSEARDKGNNINTSSTSAFKPRKHKNTTENYRDRAIERRKGISEYAEVEGVLQDFERANVGRDSSTVEENRKLLGGDEKHTVLVKGLDYALLEQQRAKLNEAQDDQDDVLLESAFRDAVVPTKKTRENIIRELKESKMAAGHGSAHDKSLDTSIQMGKFRPIGAPDESKTKKRKLKPAEGEDKKKKKAKHEEPPIVAPEPQAQASPKPRHPVAQGAPPTSAPRRVKIPSPNIDMDADIFADAGEYHGFESGSESEDGMIDLPPKPSDQKMGDAKHPRKQNWFGEPEDESVVVQATSKPTETNPKNVPELVNPLETNEEPEPVSRLQGLASSSVPSIRDILAMDEMAEKEEKRKARKEKKKGKKPSEETKINREVKQLEQYVASRHK
ncbi:hypothetical protein CPB86DRAFT_806138 [Serendipita vermifera]|nr:hypothetical protein CPB86DRAFT_806138 [Serendipita vermifera]